MRKKSNGKLRRGKRKLRSERKKSNGKLRRGKRKLRSKRRKLRRLRKKRRRRACDACALSVNQRSDSHTHQINSITNILFNEFSNFPLNCYQGNVIFKLSVTLEFKPTKFLPQSLPLYDSFSRATAAPVKLRLARIRAKNQKIVNSVLSAH